MFAILIGMSSILYIHKESLVSSLPIVTNSQRHRNTLKSSRCMTGDRNLNWDPKSAPKLDFNEDYYSLLEVDERINQQDLKRAYYKIVFKYHPDSKEGESAKELANRQMMVINAAYKVLKDVALRSEYDRKRFLKTTASPKSVPTTEHKAARSATSSARTNSDSTKRTDSTSYRGAYTSSTSSSGSVAEDGDSLMSILSEMWDEVSSNGVGNLLDDALSYFGADASASKGRSDIYESLREAKELLAVQDALIVRNVMLPSQSFYSLFLSLIFFPF